MNINSALGREEREEQGQLEEEYAWFAMVPCCHAAPRLADDWIWSNYDVKTVHTSVISAAVHCEWQFSERSQGILNHLMLCCKANYYLTRWDELFHLNGFHYRHYFPKTEGNFSSEQTTEAAGQKWRAGRWFKDLKGSQLVLFNCWLEPHYRTKLGMTKVLLRGSWGCHHCKMSKVLPLQNRYGPTLL